jgi:hypothetical protein
MRLRLKLAAYHEIKASVFLVEHVFSFRGEYAEEVKQKFVTVYPGCDVPHRNILRNFIKKFIEELDLLQKHQRLAGRKF